MNARFRPDKPRGATCKSSIVLNPQLTLDQRVPGSSPGAPTKVKSLVSNSFARCRLRTKRFSCDVLWSMMRGQIAVRLFLRFCIFTPFDTARRSDGTGRLHARRRRASKTDNLFCPTPKEPFAVEPERDGSGRGSILSPATLFSHYFLRQSTIFPDSPRWMVTPEAAA
jgi:hypothetical protein